jgi:pyruvate/2-oxoglutarate/acetoin dehydrogenase E1 component
MSEEVDLDAPPPGWGKAVVRRTGSDLVIVTYSRQVHHVMQAAEALGRRRASRRRSSICARSIRSISTRSGPPWSRSAGRWWSPKAR